MKTIIGFFTLVAIAWIGVGILWGHFLLNYDLMSIFGKSSDSFISYVIGFFTVGITLPVAVISWFVQIIGVHAPFFHV